MNRKIKKIFVCAGILAAVCGILLFGLCIWPFGLTYTLTYDCLLSDAELYDALAYLTGRRDCSMHLQTTKNSYGSETTIGTGSSGNESPDDILKRLSEAGGLIWRDYAAGENWSKRIEKTQFEMRKITMEPDFFLNTGKLNGAETVHWGFYCRFFPWFRGMFG